LSPREQDQLDQLLARLPGGWHLGEPAPVPLSLSDEAQLDQLLAAVKEVTP
jgi:hypothetical protein